MKKNNDHPGGCPPFVSTFTIRPANWLLSAERPGLPSGLGHYPEAVQTHAPPGSVPAVEYVEPSFTAEAEALMKGNTGDGGAQSLTALTKQHTAFPLGLSERQLSDLVRAFAITSDFSTGNSACGNRQDRPR
jgi:hypothetical protein